MQLAAHSAADPSLRLRIYSWLTSPWWMSTTHLCKLEASEDPSYPTSLEVALYCRGAGLDPPSCGWDWSDFNGLSNPACFRWHRWILFQMATPSLPPV